MPAIKFQKQNIAYTDNGTGKTMVLLHGFTESQKIWTGFAKQLARQFRVVTIDLPGHGRSECLEPVHTMELMAGAVYAVLKKLRAGKCLMVGHSMGGYVALAFAGKYPKMLRGLCLFHSHCFADTSVERQNRERTIKVVNEDKLSFMALFIPGLFPVEVHLKLAKQIEKLIRRAAKMSREGVVAALEGMKVRNDQSDLLGNIDLPVLFILGLKDSKAPLPRLWEMISMPRVSEVLLLRECGHMGFIEAPEETYTALAGFAKKHL